MRVRRSALALAAAAAVAVAVVTTALLAGPSRPATMEERVEEIAAGLRCPVCQNLSVADSPSEIAREMWATIARRLRRGETPEEVRAYFVERYGEWVLLSPPRGGLGILPWAGPVLALAAGGVAVTALLRKRRGAGDPPATDAERARISRELASLEEPD